MKSVIVLISSLFLASSMLSAQGAPSKTNKSSSFSKVPSPQRDWFLLAFNVAWLDNMMDIDLKSAGVMIDDIEAILKKYKVGGETAKRIAKMRAK